MNPIHRDTRKGLRLVLAAASLMFLSAGAGAAEGSAASGEAAAQRPAQELDQLDEIVVRGRVTGNMIIDAEDRFFKLYNKINKNHKFHMTCGFRSVTAGSRLQVRACVPGFITDRYSRASGPTTICTGSPVHDDFSTHNGCYLTAGYEPPPIGLLVMSHENEMRIHMIDVINSDSRLLDMAGRLDELHYEMLQLQVRYAEVRKVSRKPAKRNTAFRTRQM